MNEVEDRAMKQGWLPKEKFRGNPELWRPAEEFVRRADEMMPIMKATNKRLEDKISHLESRDLERQKTLDRILTMQAKHSKAEYEEKVSRIESEKLSAISEGDTAKYLELDRKARDIPQPDDVIQPNREEMHPAAKQFFEDNSDWWESDPDLTEYAKYIGDKLANEKHPSAMIGNEPAFFREVKERLEKTFPEKFPNPNRAIQTIDDSETRGEPASHTGPKGWNDLPPDAQKQCNIMTSPIDKGGIPGMTKEKYIKEFFEIEEG